MMQSLLPQVVIPGNTCFSQLLLGRVWTNIPDHVHHGLLNTSQNSPILMSYFLPPLVQPNSTENICLIKVLWCFPIMVHNRRTQHTLVYTRKSILCLILSPRFSSPHSLSLLRTRIMSHILHFPHIANNKIAVKIPLPFVF